MNPEYEYNIHQVENDFYYHVLCINTCSNALVHKVAGLAETDIHFNLNINSGNVHHIVANESVTKFMLQVPLSMCKGGWVGSSSHISVKKDCFIVK